MSIDVTSLVIEVKSTGVKEAADAMNKLSEAATKVEGKTKTIKEATSGLSDTQQKSVTAMEKLIAGFQKQVDLLGANTSQTNAYVASMKGASQIEQQMAAMLGAEVDAYKRLSSAQSEAVKMNNSLAAAAARQKAINQSRDVELHATAYKQLAAAQAEAIAMNKAIDASAAQRKALQQARDTEIHTAAVRAYAAAQAEAIRMNNAMDAATRKATAAQQAHNASMAEGHALARGLSGSLGALWVTYGAFAGLAVGVAIGASLKGIVSVGKDVENTLEAIRVKGLETIESVNAIRESVYSLGKGVYGPQEIAKAFETLILAGLSAKEALKGVSDALNLATVGGTSIEKAAYTVVQVGTAMGYTADQFSRISDIIAMTAAVSMSSVESLSEAFKSGSVVGKLYGVTLVDIGTSLAALSNLGIQGSAAGTSLKNFYKELSSNADKVKNTLASMKLTPESFKDGEGNYLGLLQVVEKLATGLDGLTGSAKKMAIANLSNERGMKTAVELLDLYQRKIDLATASGVEHGDMLQELRQKIEESYGYAAIGAAQMSLTVENQFKSVGNTLKTVFAEAFKSVSPQLSIVADQMKGAFNSPQFLKGLVTLAQAVGDFTVALAENIPLVIKLFEAILAYKAIGFLFGLLTSTAQGILALKAAMDLGRISAIAFQASLGLLGVVLIAAGAAYVYFSQERDKSNLSTTQKDAIKYSKDYATALETEAKRMEDQIELMLQGRTARDAETESMQRQQMALAALNRDKAINESKERVAKAAKAVTPEDMAASQRKLPNGLRPALSAAVKELQDAKNAEKEVIDKANAEYNRAEAAQARIIQAAKTKETLRIMQEAANKPKSRGTGTLDDGPDKAAMTDAFQAQLQAYQNQIKAAKREMDSAKSEAQSQYMQGLIGERGLIEANYNAEKNMAEKAIGFIQQKIDAAKGVENKKALATKFQGDLDAQQSALEAAEATRKNKYAEDEVNNQKTIQKALQEKFTSEGKFAQAYEAEFKKKHDVQIAGMLADISKEKDAVVKAEEEKVVSILNEQYEAGLAHAKNKENLASFMELSNATRNALKGVQTGSEGQGLAAMFEAASTASATLAANMDELRSRMGKLTDTASINEAQAQLTNLGESQRKLWAGVGESISKSLESAFGKSGKAAGDLIKIGQNYANLEKKTDESRIKAYGDAAGAAKGFFKEGTTGYQVLAAAEKTFRAIELAGMLQSLVMTGTVEAGKQAFKIPTVLLEFMSWMGPWGMAAGVAAVAAIGLSANGGGNSADSSAERQKTQGSGSVLGTSDAKSESIVNSLAILEKNSGLGLAHSSQMVMYLRNVSDNISSFASLLLKTTDINGKTPDDIKAFDSKGIKLMGAAGGALGGAALGTYLGMGFAAIGGPLGLALGAVIGGLLGGTFIGKALSSVFGGSQSVTSAGFQMANATLGSVKTNGVNANSYQDIKTDGGWFHGDSHDTKLTSLGQDTNDQFAKAIMSMGDTVKTAGVMLGVSSADFIAKLEQFPIKIGKIDLKGMTGDEAQKAIETVFSKLGDDMVSYALPEFKKFAKVGEGFLETIARVANDMQQVQDVFAVLNKTFDLTGVSAANVSESLISFAGGVDKLASGTQFYVENFLSEADRMAPITKSVQDYMAALHLSGVSTINDFNAIIRSLDLTDPAAQQLYAQLLVVAPAFKQAADYAEKLAEGTVTLTKAQQKALDAVTKAKSNLQDAYNSESSALQSTIDKTKTFISTLQAYQNSLKIGADSPLTNLQKYAEARNQFNNIASAARAGDATAQGQVTSAAQALLAASKVVNASSSGYTKDFNTVQQVIDDLKGAAGMQVDVAQASLDALNKQVMGLIDVNKSVMSVTDAIKALQSAITLGGIAGLTNAQMETTYTPTPQQVAQAQAAPASTGARNVMPEEVVAAIEKQTAAIEAQTVAMGAQTGAVIGAVYDSNDENADTIAHAVGSGGTKGYYKVALV